MTFDTWISIGNTKSPDRISPPDFANFSSKQTLDQPNTESVRIHTRVHELTKCARAGANPTIVSGNAGVVKIYNVAKSIARFLN
jgi:hypothetical protein